MPADYALIFRKVEETREQDPSSFTVEMITPGYSYAEALEIDELRRASVALQTPEIRSFTTT
jgi:hypothetical protein